MEVISLAAAATLTEWSERTFWRRFRDGTIEREIRNGKAVVQFSSIAAHACVPMTAEDVGLLDRADSGEAEAQTDLALLFLEHRKYKAALAWLTLAAKQDNPHAMYLLGRIYIDGAEEDKDENLGLMWLCKAASHRDQFATAVMLAIRCRLVKAG